MTDVKGPDAGWGAGRRPPPGDTALRRWLFAKGFARYSSGPFGRLLRTPAWAVFITLLVVQNPLAAGRRLRAGVVFWACQVWRRLGRTVEIDAGELGRLRCPPWSAAGAIIAATGAHEPSEMTFVLRLMRPGDVVLDAGANIGLYAVPLAMSGATVVTFEPVPRTADALEANIVLNDLRERVLLRREALSDFVGEGLVTTERDAMNRLVPPEAGEHEEVAPAAVTTLDVVVGGLAEAVDGRDIVLLKIDVEGEDGHVLDGADGLIERYRPVVMIETRFGGAEIRSKLVSGGFTLYWFDLEHGELVEFPAEWTGNYGFHTNVIAIPPQRRAFVTERLRRRATLTIDPPRAVFRTAAR